LTYTFLDFDFNAISDKNSKWVHYYDSVKDGMSNPLFIFFPAFDSTYVHLFKKRKQMHDNLTEFLKNIDSIIDQKRQTVYENIKNSKQEEEKDLLTLMIESELREDGEKLSNEELRVIHIMFYY
jgi:cytochrome P450